MMRPIFYKTIVTSKFENADLTEVATHCSCFYVTYRSRGKFKTYKKSKSKSNSIDNKLRRINLLPKPDERVERYKRDAAVDFSIKVI